MTTITKLQSDLFSTGINALTKQEIMVRQWSISDMRRLLRCAGDDVVVAERRRTAQAR